MPKDTFYNLSKEKRDHIIQAAMKVFSIQSFNEAAISEIIRHADISRGSFYQYFDDKLDLYKYLIGLFKKNYHSLMLKKFQEHDGDFYLGYKAYSCYYIRSIRESEKFGFFENLFLNMNYQLNRENINVLFTNDNKLRLYDAINLDNVSISNKEDLMEVLQFLHEVLNNAIMEGFWNNYTIEETQEAFLKRLDWVFYGIALEEQRGDEN
ncbi:MAG TPA: TetR/AcrR family transcriptional regulator [Alloiococcus sp.]|nr:TetR/AcrR family transcriptional regulator [Alloiococcus sp.]